MLIMHVPDEESERHRCGQIAPSASVVVSEADEVGEHAPEGTFSAVASLVASFASGQLWRSESPVMPPVTSHSPTPPSTARAAPVAAIRSESMGKPITVNPKFAAAAGAASAALAVSPAGHCCACPPKPSCGWAVESVVTPIAVAYADGPVSKVVADAVADAVAGMVAGAVVKTGGGRANRSSFSIGPLDNRLEWRAAKPCSWWRETDSSMDSSSCAKISAFSVSPPSTFRTIAIASSRTSGPSRPWRRL